MDLPAIIHIKMAGKEIASVDPMRTLSKRIAVEQKMTFGAVSE